jgi:hypothetical protein
MIIIYDQQNGRPHSEDMLRAVFVAEKSKVNGRYRVMKDRLGLAEVGEEINLPTLMVYTMAAVQDLPPRHGEL